MIKNGDIPEEAMEKIDEVLGGTTIEVIWAEADVVGVVGWSGKQMKKHYAYRFFKVGDRWLWSADYRQH